MSTKQYLTTWLRTKRRQITLILIGTFFLVVVSLPFENLPWLEPYAENVWWKCGIATCGGLLGWALAYAAGKLLDDLSEGKKAGEAVRTAAERWTNRSEELRDWLKSHILRQGDDKVVIRRDGLWNRIVHHSGSKRHRFVVAHPSFGKSTFMRQSSQDHGEEVVALYPILDGVPRSCSVNNFVVCIAAKLEERFLSDKSYDESICSELLLLSDVFCDSQSTTTGHMFATDADIVLKHVIDAVGQMPKAAEKRYFILVDALDELGSDKSIKALLFQKSIWAGWEKASLITTATGEELLESDDEWEYLPLNDKAADDDQFNAMVDYATAHNASDLFDERDKPQVAVALCDRAKRDFSLLTCFIKDARKAGNEEKLTLAWIAELKPTRLEYFEGKFRQWFGDGEDYQRAQRLVSLLLCHEQNAPVAIRHLAKASSPSKPFDDTDRSYIKHFATRLDFAIQMNLDEYGGNELAIRGDTSIYDWLKCPPSNPGPMAEGFRSRVSKEVGHRLWADYVFAIAFPATVKESLRPTLSEHEFDLRFVFDHGLRHCREHAIATAKCSRAEHESYFLALTRLLHVYKTIYESLDTANFPDVTALRLRCPRLSIGLFDVLAKYEQCFDAAMPSLDRDVLIDVLNRAIMIGVQEIPQLARPLRVFVRIGLANSGALDEQSLKHAINIILKFVHSDQLLTRYAISRSIAYEAHQGGPGSRQFAGRLVERLREVGKEDYDALETAAYVAKFLWCHASPSDELRDLHDSFGKEMALSANYNLRMAYQESLIERACNPGPKLANEPLSKVARWGDAIWSPIWDYHCIDLAEAFVTRQSRNGNGQPIEQHDVWSDTREPTTDCERFARNNRHHCWVVHNRFQELLSDLTSMVESDDTPGVVRKAADKYWWSDELLELLVDWPKVLSDCDLETCFRYLKPIAWHPVWEITEAAASVVASIRENYDIERGTTLIQKFETEEYWQSLYAAVDAAYDSHSVDEGIARSEFARLVRAHYDCKHSRVRFICAEDAFLWYFDLANTFGSVGSGDTYQFHKGQALLQEWFDTFKSGLKYWFLKSKPPRAGVDKQKLQTFRDGEYKDSDCTLLYECFQFARDILHKRTKDDKAPVLNDLRAQIKELASDSDVTPLLSVPDRTVDKEKRWWELEKEDWLHALDRQRRIQLETVSC